MGIFETRPLRVLSILVAAGILLSGCGSDTPSSTQPSLARSAAAPPLVALVRALAVSRNIGPLPAPPPVRTALARLGQALAFDKILSGNRDISCMTCHLSTFATGDARSLSIGQGAVGLGPNRVHPQGIFIPRNAPPLFNLHVLNHLFFDGRVELDPQGAFHTPAGTNLTPEMTKVFEFGALSAQPLFPVLSRDEMRANTGNELAAIDDAHMGAIWRAIMLRLGAIPQYREMFEAAYPGTRFETMTFAHGSNAIAGFFLSQLTSKDAPWDRFLAGNDEALNGAQLIGAKDFLSLKCSICHNGPTFSDDKFHNVALAQFGPGKGNGPSGRDDFGRMNISRQETERYAFRTTPLRNVELTGPYGHDGAFIRLRDFIAHYSESDLKLRSYDVSQLEPALRPTLLATVNDILLTRDLLLQGVVIPDSIVDHLETFMRALTEEGFRHLDRIVPQRVPSGLPIDR